MNEDTYPCPNPDCEDITQCDVCGGTGIITASEEAAFNDANRDMLNQFLDDWDEQLKEEWHVERAQ